jgi:hypothetical protein
MSTRYKIYLLLIFTIIIQNEGNAQKVDSNRVTQFGFIFTYDLSFNFPDKVLSPGLERKMSLGVRYSNKKRSFMTFAAFGIKGAKINLYSPKFQHSFIEDLQNNYTPIQTSGQDSLVGALMNNGGNRLWGTYSQYLHFGIGLLNRFRPTLSFHFGYEHFLLHDQQLRKYVDPEYGDIDYVGMRTSFYELKLGFVLPFKNWNKSIFAPNISFGYQWTDYNGFKFDTTQMEDYTSADFVQKYNRTGKFTVSLTFYLW